MRNRNPFDMLGISPDAEREVIRAAYRALAKKYHPDTRGGDSGHYASERMAQLNWAWEELQKDLSGWRARARSEPGTPETRAQPQSRGEPDEDAWWQEFTKAYKRDKRGPLGWREWIGTDVVCRYCGCVLKTWVYKCPDCMRTGTWSRSRLHTVGHKLRIVYWIVIFGVAYAIAVPFLLGLLAVPPILLIDFAGMGNGAVWDWKLYEQALLALGIAAEIGIWGILANWKRVKAAAVRYWEE